MRLWGAAKDGDARTILDGAKNGAINEIHAHLLHTEEIVLGEIPGVSFVAENNDARITGRMFLEGTTLYQIFVVETTGSNYQSTAQFLDSFQFIPRETL